MSFHLTVQGSEDDGKSFRVDGPCIVGRAPACQVCLADPQVAWEHTSLQDQAGRLYLQNLAASGVRVHGRPVTSEVRLNHGDVVELTPDCNLVVEERVGRRGRGVRLTPPVLLGILAVFAVVLFAAFRALREETPPPPPRTLEHWRTAHQRLTQRMEDWVDRDQFPQEALALFRDAWRLEVAYNARGAEERWSALRSVLLTLPLPGRGADPRTIAEAASPTPRALDVIMDWAPDTSLSLDPRWRTDEAYADALSWFVQQRAERAREKMEAGE